LNKCTQRNKAWLRLLALIQRDILQFDMLTASQKKFFYKAIFVRINANNSTLKNQCYRITAFSKNECYVFKLRQLWILQLLY
jgi:hypothetical protein